MITEEVLRASKQGVAIQYQGPISNDWHNFELTDLETVGLNGLQIAYLLQSCDWRVKPVEPVVVPIWLLTPPAECIKTECWHDLCDYLLGVGAEWSDSSGPGYKRYKITVEEWPE